MARARKARDYAPDFDGTFGDGALAVARQDVTFGRWQGPADLLRDTGTDWDRRTHRVRLLAQAAAGTSVVEEWHTARPRDPDALVLRAETEVMRCFNLAMAAGGAAGVDTTRLESAVGTCLRAAEAHPADPMPWVSLLTVARLFEGGHRHADRWWHELQLRDRDNREAHHQVLRHMSARWHGSHGAMYNFARDVAGSIPAGSPLAVLLQLARAEEYRYRLDHEGEQALGLGQHWRGELALADTRRTWDLWIVGWDGRHRAQDTADLNYLLHAACHGGLDAEAAHLFGLVGTAATRVPWSYHGDPAAVVTQWHARITGS
jgi:hypothetical protein